MSGDFDINKYRRSHLEDESEGKEISFKILAIGVIGLAVVAAIGFEPLMNIRKGQVQKMAAMESEVQHKKTAPIDSNSPFDSSVLLHVSDETKAKVQKNYADRKEAYIANLKAEAETNKKRRALGKKLKIKDWVVGKDLYQLGKSPNDIMRIRYNRAYSTLAQCGNDFYPIAKRYKEKNYSVVKSARKQKSGTPSHFALGPEVNKELASIETQGDAMKFVASGGAFRAQKAGMGTMMDLAIMNEIREDAKKSGKKLPSVGLDYDMGFDRTISKQDCAVVRNRAQSGALDL